MAHLKWQHSLCRKSVPSCCHQVASGAGAPDTPVRNLYVSPSPSSSSSCYLGRTNGAFHQSPVRGVPYVVQQEGSQHHPFFVRSPPPPQLAGPQSASNSVRRKSTAFDHFSIAEAAMTEEASPHMLMQVSARSCPRRKHSFLTLVDFLQTSSRPPSSTPSSPQHHIYMEVQESTSSGHFQPIQFPIIASAATGGNNARSSNSSQSSGYCSSPCTSRYNSLI